MSSLLTRAHELTEALAKYDALKKAAQSLKELQHRREQLQKELDRLRPATALLEAVRSRSAALPASNEPDVKKATERIADLKRAFASDPHSVVRDDFAASLQIVRKGVAALEANAKVAWSSLATPVRDEVRPELLEALARVPAWRSAIAGIRDVQNNLAGLAAKPLVTRSEFERFFELAEERAAAWNALHGGAGIPPGVVEFMQGCAGDGVPFDRVTEDVTQWLRSHDILQYFRVRL